MRSPTTGRRRVSFLGGALALTFLLTACAGAPSSSGAGDTVRFGVFNWEGARITTNILVEITRQHPKLGVDEVELRTLGTTAGWTALGGDDVDVLTEVAWPNQKPLYQKSKQETTLVSKTYGPVPQGWFVPSYVVKPGGQAPALDRVAQLDEYTDMFEGKLYDGPQGWITTGWNNVRLKAYGLGGYEHVQASEAAYLAQVEKSIEKKKPIVFYLWHPHWAFAKFDLTQLEEAKPHEKGCLDKASKGPCAMPGQQAHIAVRKDLREKAPKLYAFLQEFKLEVPQLEKMLAETTQEDKPVKRVAKEWVASHQSQIQSWVDKSTGS